MSANFLTWVGVPYVADGGNLSEKLHPGTDLLLISFICMLLSNRGFQVLVRQKLTSAFLASMLCCLVYLAALTGTGYLVVLLDTFIPAGLLALILSQATEGDIRCLRKVMQVVLACNALLALVEMTLHATLIPLYLNQSAYHPHVEDFRPTALFDHPLTGSVMIMLGIALTPEEGLSRAVYAALMAAALIAFGGRTATMTCVVIALTLGFVQAAKLVLSRDRRAVRMILIAAATVASTACILFVAAKAGFGARLAGHLYWDESAQVRLAQWELLDHLDTSQLLFGIRREDLFALLTPLHLGSGVEVIENFWLLMFVSLGIAGFPMFAGGLFALLAWCWQRSLLQGRLLLCGVLLVASTSNSLGRKSTILVCLVATIVCLPGRRNRVRMAKNQSRAGAVFPRMIAA